MKKFTPANTQYIRTVRRSKGALSAASGGPRPTFGEEQKNLKKSETQLNKAKQNEQRVKHKLSEKRKQIVRAERRVKQLRANENRLGAQKKGAALRVIKKEGIYKNRKVSLLGQKAAQGAYDRVRRARRQKRIKPLTNTAKRVFSGVQHVSKGVINGQPPGAAVSKGAINTGTAVSKGVMKFVGNTVGSAGEFVRDPLGIVSNIKSINWTK